MFRQPAGNIMRRDRNTGQIYQNYGDWLFNYGHSLWILTLFFGYGWYLGSTDEVKNPKKKN
jgi:hypothetical protein